MSALDDLLDNLFNPFAPREGGGLINPYAPPTTGTPSLTNPGTYVPPPNAPPGPVPYTPYTPPPLIPGGNNGGGDNGGGDNGGGDNGGGDNGGGNNNGGGDNGGGNNGGGNNGGGNSGGDPYAAGGGYAPAPSLAGTDPYGHSKRGSIYTGHGLSKPSTMSMEDFVNNVLPNAAGNYGEGMHYDPETGSVWNNVSPERLQSLSDKNVAMMGVNTKYLSDDQVYRNYLHGHNPGATTGMSMVRMGGDTGQYYFLDPANNQVVVYNYKQTMDSSSPLVGTPDSNILSNRGTVGDPYAGDLTQDQRGMMPALRKNMEAEQAIANSSGQEAQEQLAQEQEGPLASELLLGEPTVTEMPAELPPLPDESGLRQTIPEPSSPPPTTPSPEQLAQQIRESFGGLGSITSPFGGFINLPSLAPPPPAAPSLSMAPSPAAPPSMTRPLMPPRQQMAPPPITPSPMPSLAPQPPMAPPPMAPPPMAPPPMAPQPPMSTDNLYTPPKPMAPPPMAPPPMAPPPPAPTAPPGMPNMSPQQLAALEKALAQMQGMSINFNQGGPVESGVGSLFLREVMR